MSQTYLHFAEQRPGDWAERFCRSQGVKGVLIRPIPILLAPHKEQPTGDAWDLGWELANGSQGFTGLTFSFN